MASGPIVGGDEGAKEKPRNTERKVYTRKVFKGSRKDPNALNTAAPATTATAKKDDTATGKNEGTVTAISDTATATTSATTTTAIAETTGDTTTAKIDNTAAAKIDNATTAKNDDTVTAINDTAIATTSTATDETGNTATAKNDDAAINNTATATTSTATATTTITTAETDNTATAKTDNAATDRDVDRTTEAAATATLTGISAATLATENTDDSNTNGTVKNSDTSEPKINSNDISAEPSILAVTLPGDVNLAQPQVNSTLKDVCSAQQQENSRLEDEDSAILQVSSRLEDGDLTQPLVDSRVEDENLAQPQVGSRLEDGDIAQPQLVSSLVDENLAQPQVSSRLEDRDLVLQQVDSRLESRNSAQPPVVQVSDDSCRHQQEELSSLNVQRDDDGPVSLEFQQDAVPSTRNQPLGNEAMEPELEERVKISFSSKSKQEMRELRWKLENELDVVRNLVKRIELKQGQVSGCGRMNVFVGDRINNGSGTKRALSEVVSAVVPQESTRPLHQLSLSLLENSHVVSENVEKEKRTPKANQFYCNSEFLLAKDKFPPAESNKKSKLHWKKQVGGEMGQGLLMGSKFYKSCSSLLEKLMKHKHGWVFNDPVDVEGLGLHDYFSIITHPMDLGTVKTRLNKNWYKSPKEFAEDVRLTFHNAMTYNPKGQDVHVMAEQLLKVFEDRWAIIESDYNREMRYGIDYGAAPAPSPLSRKVPTFPPPPLDMRRILNRSESLTHTPRLMSITPSSRTPAPKKPKAKDPNKRDMTFEEKQKLSTNLQSLPSEKLDAIVQIIKKRTLALSQRDDEIEVDIDSVDAETLWELDRFVTNYKKSLSKNKRKLELAQARAEAQRNALQKNQAPVMQIEVPRETEATDEQNVPPSLPVQGGNHADHGSRSSSSSSSSSDSGSSSSDSDSDSSSASGSDAGSQGT